MTRTLQKLHQRFDELQAQIAAVEATKKTYEFGGFLLDNETLLNWEIKVRNLLNAACGQDSEHYKSCIDVAPVSMYRPNYDRFIELRAIFLAAKEDYVGGYIVSIRKLVESEVFSSELDQARELLASGYVAASAIVSGVVLETALRAMCAERALAVGKLDKMNSDLVKAGAYTLLVQKRITVLADVRNNAAHGHVERFNANDVSDMIIYTERFLTDYT